MNVCVCVRTCVHVSVQSVSIEEPDGSEEEAVTRSGREGPNASVSFSRQQGGESV